MKLQRLIYSITHNSEYICSFKYLILILANKFISFNLQRVQEYVKIRCTVGFKNRKRHIPTLICGLSELSETIKV